MNPFFQKTSFPARLALKAQGVDRLVSRDTWARRRATVIEAIDYG
jgi:hypothetical protein